jgi:hypothetical protein
MISRTGVMRMTTSPQLLLLLGGGCGDFRAWQLGAGVLALIDGSVDTAPLWGILSLERYLGRWVSETRHDDSPAAVPVS